MHLGPYFIFTQMKATLRAGRKEVEVGGESSEDREAISLQVPWKAWCPVLAYRKIH